MCLDELRGILENTEAGSCTIVCGDLNGDMGSKGGQRGLNRCTKEGDQVYEFMQKHDMLTTNLSNLATGAINTYF